MLDKFFDFIFGKLNILCTTIYGWLSIIISAFVAFLADSTTLLQYCIFAVILDMIFAIIQAYKTKHSVQSAKVWKTICKIGAVTAIFLLIVILDKIMINESFAITRCFTCLCIASEIISIVGHLCIIAPNNKVLKFLSVWIVDEVSKKLELSESAKEKLEDIAKTETKE